MKQDLPQGFAAMKKYKITSNGLPGVAIHCPTREEYDRVMALKPEGAILYGLDWLFNEETNVMFDDDTVFQYNGCRGYECITAAQFLADNSPEEPEEIERMVIGYKLIRPEYLGAIEAITQVSDYSSLLQPDNFFAVSSLIETSMKNAGVLDLWFEPVYDQPRTFTQSEAMEMFQLLERWAFICWKLNKEDIFAAEYEATILLIQKYKSA